MVDLKDIEAKKSKTYNRKNYENKQAMSNYKNEKFSGKQTTEDEYTGKRVHLKKENTQKKYHNNYNENLANTDHVKPLKDGYEQTKYNYFVSDDQLKSALNNSANFAITSAALNQSKQDMTNTEFIKKNNKINAETEQRMKRKEKKAEQEFEKNIRKATVNSISKIGKESAINAGSKCLMEATAGNIIKVTQGERELDDALTDIICTSLKSCVESACSDVAQVALLGERERLIDVIQDPKKKEKIQNLMKNENLGLLMAVASNVSSLTVKFLKGDISTEDYGDQLLDTSVNTSLFYLLAMASAPFGAVAGVVVNFVATKVLEVADRWLEENAGRELRIENYHKIEKMLKEEGDKVTKILDVSKSNYERDTSEAIANITNAFQTGNEQCYELGLQSLCKSYDLELAIKSDEEMSRFLQSEKSCLILGDQVQMSY